MTIKRFSLILAFLSLLALFLAACQGAQETSEEAGEAEQSAPAQATFVATEYAYDGPETLEAGWTQMTLDNQGELAHDLILVKLGEGKTMADVMAALEAGAPPDWAEFYGGTSAEAGQSASYYVETTPGNYILLSFGAAEDAPPDAAQGMIAELTITETSTSIGQPALPAADANVELVDYAFNIDSSVSPSEQLLQVTNKGTELHEVIAFRLQEGMTMEDLMAGLESEMGGGDPAAGAEGAAEEAPPFEQVGGTFLSPGISTLVSMDFSEPGTYVFICFIPSAKNDMQPHFALGMLSEVTVQ